MSGCGPLPSVGLTQAAIRLRGVRVTAPETLRRRLRGFSTKELVAVAARFRPGGNPGDVEEATRFALRSVARRYQALSEEIALLDAQLDRLVAESAPELTSLPAIGTEISSTDHHSRCRLSMRDGQGLEEPRRVFGRPRARSSRPRWCRSPRCVEWIVLYHSRPCASSPS